MSQLVRAPDDAACADLVRRLAAAADTLDATAVWPSQQLELCAASGVFAWFLPAEAGGQAWTERDIARGYVALARACLTTTFVITQRTAACQRIAASDNDALRARLLPRLATTAEYATVAISHLSTSRRHLQGPVLRAAAVADGFELHGYSAWVTGAIHARTIVVGATLDDGHEILAAVAADAPGITVDPPATLVGLSASHTGRVRFAGVRVARGELLFGPVENVMRVASAGTGGLQTSALAVGLADAAIDYLGRESERRSNLRDAAEALRDEWTRLYDELLAAAGGDARCSPERLRGDANSLVLRATQAALVAAKGTGYVVGHPAGRWCREALFFLVWSCPQGVSDAHLCELAGLGEDHVD